MIVMRIFGKHQFASTICLKTPAFVFTPRCVRSSVMSESNVSISVSQTNALSSKQTQQSVFIKRTQCPMQSDLELLLTDEIILKWL